MIWKADYGVFPLVVVHRLPLIVVKSSAEGKNESIG